MAKRRAGREERHEEVLAAAARVIASRGYRRSTLQEVAAELDLTGAALYYYVSSKEDLLVEICQRAGDRLHESAQDILARDLPPVEKLELFVRRHLELTHEERAIFSILIQERSEIPDDRREELLQGERAYFATARKLIEDVAGPSCDARLDTFALMGMLNWAVRWYRDDGEYSLDDVVAEFTRLFLYGVRPRAGGAGEADGRVDRDGRVGHHDVNATLDT